MITQERHNIFSGSNASAFYEQDDTAEVLKRNKIYSMITELVLNISHGFKQISDIVSFSQRKKSENEEIFIIFEAQVRDLVIPRIASSLQETYPVNPEARNDGVFFEELIQFFTGLQIQMGLLSQSRGIVIGERLIDFISDMEKLRLSGRTRTELKENVNCRPLCVPNLSQIKNLLQEKAMEFIVRNETTLISLEVANRLQHLIDKSEKFQRLENIFQKRRGIGFIVQGLGLQVLRNESIETHMLRIKGKLQKSENDTRFRRIGLRLLDQVVSRSSLQNQSAFLFQLLRIKKIQSTQQKETQTDLVTIRLTDQESVGRSAGRISAGIPKVPYSDSKKIENKNLSMDISSSSYDPRSNEKNQMSISSKKKVQIQHKKRKSIDQGKLSQSLQKNRKQDIVGYFQTERSIEQLSKSLKKSEKSSMSNLTDLKDPKAILDSVTKNYKRKQKENLQRNSSLNQMSKKLDSDASLIKKLSHAQMENRKPSILKKSVKKTVRHRQGDLERVSKSYSSSVSLSRKTNPSSRLSRRSQIESQNKKLQDKLVQTSTHKSVHSVTSVRTTSSRSPRKQSANHLSDLVSQKLTMTQNSSKPLQRVERKKSTEIKQNTDQQKIKKDRSRSQKLRSYISKIGSLQKLSKTTNSINLKPIGLKMSELEPNHPQMHPKGFKNVRKLVCTPSELLQPIFKSKPSSSLFNPLAELSRVEFNKLPRSKDSKEVRMLKNLSSKSKAQNNSTMRTSKLMESVKRVTSGSKSLSRSRSRSFSQSRSQKRANKKLALSKQGTNIQQRSKRSRPSGDSERMNNSENTTSLLLNQQRTPFQNCALNINREVVVAQSKKDSNLDAFGIPKKVSFSLNMAQTGSLSESIPTVPNISPNQFITPLSKVGKIQKHVMKSNPDPHLSRPGNLHPSPNVLVGENQGQKLSNTRIQAHIFKPGFQGSQKAKASTQDKSTLTYDIIADDTEDEQHNLDQNVTAKTSSIQKKLKKLSKGDPVSNPKIPIFDSMNPYLTDQQGQQLQQQLLDHHTQEDILPNFPKLTFNLVKPKLIK